MASKLSNTSRLACEKVLAKQSEPKMWTNTANAQGLAILANLCNINGEGTDEEKEACRLDFVAEVRDNGWGYYSNLAKKLVDLGLLPEPSKKQQRIDEYK